MDKLVAPATFIAAIGAALSAGTFLAFSSFVMKALGRLPPAQGVAAMQAVNITVIGSLFLFTFIGVALLSAVLGVAALVSDAAGPARTTVLLASALYVIGGVGVTAAFNVPRNNALATLDPSTPIAAQYWATYLTSWTAWNHARTLACALSAGLFTLAFATLRAR